MALGRIHEQGIGTKVDIELAVHYYDSAAQLNVPYAWYWLGNICETGQHPYMKGEDLVLAFKFYKKAVDIAEKKDK